MKLRQGGQAASRLLVGELVAEVDLYAPEGEEAPACRWEPEAEVAWPFPLVDPVEVVEPVQHSQLYEQPEPLR